MQATNLLKGISQRHKTGGTNRDNRQDVGGAATVGIVSGASVNLTYKKFYAMAQTGGRTGRPERHLVGQLQPLRPASHFTKGGP